MKHTYRTKWTKRNLRNRSIVSFFSHHLHMRRTHLMKSKMASSAGPPNKYTYPACWFFKFISPDINGMQWAVGSHRSGSCTKTFTGYVVTAYNQSFTNRKEEKSRKKLQYCTSELLVKTGLLSNDEYFSLSILHTLQLVSDSCERVKNECVKFIGRATVTECQKNCALL